MPRLLWSGSEGQAIRERVFGEKKKKGQTRKLGAGQKEEERIIKCD